MKKIIVLNKKEGETPLEALEEFRRKHQGYKEAKMTYAGRLDPMANGVLLVLAGEEVKNKEKYLGLDKEYEFEVLFGAATDTYDILGKISHSNILKNIKMSELEKLTKKNLKFFIGKFTQAYPAYSSKTVKGKPLFQYARDGKGVETQTREIIVKKLKFLKIRKINSNKLLANVHKRISKVRGDFRQEEILNMWDKFLGGESREYFIASFKVKCGSGTYVRGIAHSLGEKVGVPALAYSINRTKVGKFGKMS
ncbi:MAG: hypothetical protein WAV15_01500 [Minisyncoccia bacterium]